MNPNLGPTRRRRFIARAHLCGPPADGTFVCRHPLLEVPWPFPSFAPSDPDCSMR